MKKNNEEMTLEKLIIVLRGYSFFSNDIEEAIRKRTSKNELP